MRTSGSCRPWGSSDPGGVPPRQLTPVDLLLQHLGDNVSMATASYAHTTWTPASRNAASTGSGAPESVTRVSTLLIGQIRAKACPPSLDESAITTTRLARATIRLFIA